jgi:hypothetical protein
MQQIKITANPSKFNHRQACTFLRRRIYGPLLDQLNFYIILAFIVVFLAFSVIQRTPSVSLPDWIQWAALAGFLLVLYAIRQMKQTRMAAAGGPVQQTTGQSAYEVSAEGLKIITPEGHTFARWHAIREIISTPQGLMLLVAAMQYFAIPSEAFDTRAEQDQMADQIRTLIKDEKA